MKVCCHPIPYMCRLIHSRRPPINAANILCPQPLVHPRYILLEVAPDSATSYRNPNPTLYKFRKLDGTCSHSPRYGRQRSQLSFIWHSSSILVCLHPHGPDLSSRKQVCETPPLLRLLRMILPESSSLLLPILRVLLCTIGMLGSSNAFRAFHSTCAIPLLSATHSPNE